MIGRFGASGVLASGVGAAAVAALLLVGCSTAPAAPRPTPVADAPTPVSTPGPEGAPSGAVGPRGTVTVAVPAPPATWWARDDGDLAARDLAALWALPLFRTDDLGRTRPGLGRSARQVADDSAWVVEVDLATGEWSDGRPVVAADVVATADALAEARPAAWAAFLGAVAVDLDTVRLRFDRPFARWWALLSEPPGVLPAHVLAEDGLAAWRDDVPVSGGPFVLTAQRPGVSSEWTAHDEAPAGAPRLSTVEVLVVPDLDVALGLLADGATDVVAGHLALDPAARAAEVTGAVTRLPFGGTRLEIAWDPGSSVPEAARRALAAVLDPVPFVDGLLRGGGRPASGTLPGTTAAVSPGDETDVGDDVQGAVRAGFASTVEQLGLLGRLVRRDASRTGLDVRLLRRPPPEHLGVGGAAPADDLTLRAVRRGPLPSAAGVLAAAGLDPAPGLVADARGRGPASSVAGPDQASPWTDVDDLLATSAAVVPVADVAPVHVWVPERAAGVTPSAWPGLALWDVAAWRAP